MRSCCLALVVVAGCRANTTSSRAPQPETEASIGSARPLVVGRVDPHGRWVFFCQVQRDTNGNGEIWGGASNHGLAGDAFEPRLWLEGHEHAIEAFLDASADGRWLATREGGRAWLRDLQTGARTELPIAADGDPYSFAPRAELAPDGARMLYVRDGGDVVVRELATGHETVRRAPEGELWRAWFDGDGEHVWAEVVTADTDGDGVLAVPRAETNLVVGSCSASTATSTWGGWYGDAPVRHAGLGDGALARVQGGLAFFGGGVIVRSETGALELRRGDQTTVLAPDSCGATIVHLDRARGRVVLTCDAAAEVVHTQHDAQSYSTHRWVPLHLWEKGSTRSLGASILAPHDDRLDGGAAVTEARDGSTVDLVTGVSSSEPQDRILATHGRRGLVIRHDGTPCMEDLRDRTRECFEGDERIDPTFYASDMRVAGKMVLTPIGDRRAALLDLEAARVLGFVADRDRVHGLDARGRLLVGEPDVRGVIAGPLRWDAGVARGETKSRRR